MDIAKMILFLVIMMELPYLVGTSCRIAEGGSEIRTILEKWNFGMVFMYAIFEVLVLAGTFGRISLRKVSVIYILVLLVVIIVGIALKLRHKDKKQQFSLHISKDKWALILMALVLFGIVYQMIFVCRNMHIDEDDAYYVGMAVTSYYSNTISVNHPYLGTAVELKQMANYVLSPYPVYCAMWSQLLDLHPAILMRSILPAVNIAWAYVVYYLLTGTLFQKFEQQMEFMAFVVLANFFGAYSGVASSMFLLVRIWQGKAVIAAVFIPMLWYIWMRIRKQSEKKELWIMMFFAVIGACLCSSMAMFLCPILLGAFGLQYLTEQRSWENVGKLVVCALPCLALAVGELCLIYM